MSLPVNAGWLEGARLALANVAAEQPCRTPMVACAVCTAPVSGYEFCYKCNGDRNGDHRLQLADLVAPLAYAWDGESQLGKDVYSYKQSHEQLAANASARLGALVYTFGTLHALCPQRRLGRPVTAKAIVPSLKGNPGTRLAHMADRFLPGWPRIPVAAAGVFGDDNSRRALDPTHFSVDPRDVPHGAHVLVLEDTWVTGGHSQAVAVTLKQAGAATVTVVPICRLLKPGWGPNRTYRGSAHSRLWSPDTCPVTGSTCP
jgi:predicted amidophosphoribosyltransferase